MTIPRHLPRRRLLDRAVSVRDAAIFHLATEDTHAADQYFRALQDNGVVDRSRVRILVLPTSQGQSSPAWLVQRLDEHRLRLDTLLPQDEFWLLPDIDHHRDKELSAALVHASQKGYRVAASNPCFEIWLLLHETDDLSAIQTHSEHAQAASACEAHLRAASAPTTNAGSIPPATRPRRWRSPSPALAPWTAETAGRPRSALTSIA